MKKLIVLFLILIGLYYSFVIVWAELSDRKAEKYMTFLFPEISKPWDENKFLRYCSVWLCSRPGESAEIVRPLDQALGSLQEIIEAPNCGFASGYYDIPDQKKESQVFAICSLTARFEKFTARLKIRLVEEPRQPYSFFEPLGRSLKISKFLEIKVSESPLKERK